MKIYLIAATVVLGAGAWLAASDSPVLSDVTAEPAEVALAPEREALDIPLSTDKVVETQPQNSQEEQNTALNQKVAKALERFKEQTAHISREDVEEQQEAVRQFKERSLAQKPVEPTVELVDDGHGRTIKKYTYPDGIVRYSL